MSREPSIRPARSASDIVHSKLPAFPAITILISRPARSSAFDDERVLNRSEFQDPRVRRRQRRMSERRNWTDGLERMRSKAAAFLGMECVDDARYRYVYPEKSTHFDNPMAAIVPLLAN